ncbi:MAG: Flagellar hook-associated protein FlgK [Hydrogenibacillus schlegelii]|uniref:Flagellar hook-associated protein 1 n=1 Tax=Hydrogenibacillus schlegelii TaxID=1484 RepID=A0A2T5GBG9_HYDSH|nr:flagellar hook-associated protein FlgK [Hydrogenibacillus schlegelii]PTQ53540.1 MAG: Flagellar hook-associated protein FlgK [Hydrogenibacillus schlegelii]
MRSTFTGVEIARRALFAQQAALQTTEHNVANANTDGYTRQRAELVAARPLPYPGLTMGALPGQIGMGVDVARIARLRDGFLDRQYREERAAAAYYETLSNVYDRLQAVLREDPELGGTGLLAAADAFFGAFDDLALNAERGEAREQAIGAAQSLVDAFWHIAESLDRIRGDLDFQVRQIAEEVNSIARRIADLNGQIGRLRPHGLMTNDWEDARDHLLDELAARVDLEVVDLGNGMIRVTIAGGKTLVDGTDVRPLEIGTDGAGRTTVALGGEALQARGGTLQAAMEARDRVLADLQGRYDALARAFQAEVNRRHMAGVNLRDILAGKTDPSNIPLFVSRSWLETLDPAVWDQLQSGTLSWTDAQFLDPNADPPGSAYVWEARGIGDVAVNPLLVRDRTLLAAAGAPPTGIADGRTAKALAALRTAGLPGLPTGEAFGEAYGSLIGRLGIDAQRTDHLREMKATLVEQVDRQRQSVHGVSLDEEMTKLIEYQHAYSAAARALTAIDQLLDRLINGTGLVGR